MCLPKPFNEPSNQRQHEGSLLLSQHALYKGIPKELILLHSEEIKLQQNRHTHTYHNLNELMDVVC